MKVLFVASEGVPFIKSGGLGDVIGALPKALRKHDIDVRVIIPLYRDISKDYKDNMSFLKSIVVKLAWRNQYCGIFQTEYEGVKFYFIDNEYYFKRDRLYGYGDDAERYAFFSKSVLDILPEIDFRPDIIHCHDWHAGLVSVFLKTHYKYSEFHKNILTLFTIHNLHYQGIFSKEILKNILDLDDEYLTIDTLEYYGDINCMKGGVIFSDILNTVSKSYAEEIKYPYFGEGLDGILRKRFNDLKGIVNGIDYDMYNPKTDPYIYKNYDSNNLDFKNQNKINLQRELELNVNGSKPIVGIVSRLVSGKGMDLIAHILEELLCSTDIQIVVLGTGEAKYEDVFKSMSYRFPERVSANITFHDQLAHKIYAGSDILLMPSRFEPCGLSQLIALRYGTIPVVRETGGLKDTVYSFNENTMEGNGFAFKNYNAHDMLFTLKRAISIYEKKDIWTNLVKRAMGCDYSWNNSAKEYIELYMYLINNRGGCLC
ncbi:glycogen synthase GlgA [Gottschalkia purinilytica]|uniref:Glycogen synthase n=1 Tax=Gottschalkia purinilytica TaxID=1503 RepID=A0A0L0W9D5_GOTPU|nr:glycogen synthase GlgA [Gottschalkia purinilytica]KNF07925.1 glycogen synthase GlgA [Gottschalkia purinilytica]